MHMPNPKQVTLVLTGTHTSMLCNKVIWYTCSKIKSRTFSRYSALSVKSKTCTVTQRENERSARTYHGRRTYHELSDALYRQGR